MAKENHTLDLHYEDKISDPVACLGMEFENDEDRRAYFTEQLRQKLQDPKFRKIEGFPIGTDESILELSDPPYYTACPNPWIADFVNEWEAKKLTKPADYHYHREPFATDIKEGKNDPIYNAHSYHTKVPHKAIMRYILHYTDPGDIVLDSFAGTGMTGVAAQLCGDRDMVLSLGYQIKPDGTILQEEQNEDGKNTWVPFSKFGSRHALLNDLSPAATFIGYNYNTPVDTVKFEKAAKEAIKKFKQETEWMWETIHSDGKTIGKVNYIVWSDVYTCPECSGELIYFYEAFSKKDNNVEFTPEFNCPTCHSVISKNPSKDSTAQKPIRLFVSNHNQVSNKVERKQKQYPVMLNYSISTKRYEKFLDENDKRIIESIKKLNFPVDNIPFAKIIDGDKSSDPYSCGIEYVHQFYTDRILISLGILKTIIQQDPQLNFLMGSMLPKLTIMNRYMPQHGSRALVGPMANTLYVPPVSVENNVVDQLIFQYKKIIQALTPCSGSIITTQGAQSLAIPENSLDYIFLDPPFGANIMYSELSYIREAWLDILTNNGPEAIESKTQKKGINEYRSLMTECFEGAYKYLKPGRWMTVEFSNTKSSVWNSIQNALSDAGFIIASVSALDKTRGGLHSMLGTTAVKQDLIISAYKPNGGFEDRFKEEAQTEEGVWDFVRTHLGYLTSTRGSTGELEFIPERDPRILFDQVVAYYVRKGYMVPISSPEFQIGLAQRFAERDGMYFLPEQVAEYDKKKMSVKELGQMSFFVSDESSAIAWLRQQIKLKPQTFQDLNPQFMQETTSGWNSNEKMFELSTLLEENFLMYNGKGKVPEQIHAYLSTNWKDMRNLDKEDPVLMEKAKNRWFVPDPNKVGDLEKVREKSLLKEFEAYKAEKKKLKLFRIEAVRAGFKKAWQERDYKTIIAIAEKIPTNVLEEDPKLLMWFDQSVTRIGD